MERIGYFFRNTLGGGELGAIYVANFLIGLHLFLVIYINSTYVATFLPEKLVGLIYMGGPAIGLVALAFASRFLEHFGMIRMVTILAALEFLVFIGLAFPGHVSILIALYLIHTPLAILLLYTLDIFVESLTKKESVTGNVRGVFLTTTNTALVISPLIAGFILGEDQYWRVFVIAAFTLIPFLIIIRRHFKTFDDPEYHAFNLRTLFTCLTNSKGILTVFKAHFLMRIFFVWMVIYTPIYLNQHIGFDWPAIGVIFTIMLLPYLLFELPAGKLADSRWGERGLMSLGFVIMGVSVGLMSFLTTPSVVLWAGLLFLTRTGAALLEIMTETHFFRQVDEDDPNTISAFRMLRPLSYVVGSSLGVATIFVIDIQYMFLVLATVVLFGLRYSLTLRRTESTNVRTS